jgi:hypothetical protein
MRESALSRALLACADGISPVAAGVELLLDHGSFVQRADFTTQFVICGTSVPNGATALASVDWEAAIRALDAGEMLCSGGEQRMLRLAASLAAGIPVSLSDTVAGLDQSNLEFLISAIRRASGPAGTAPLPAVLSAARNLSDGLP